MISSIASKLVWLWWNIAPGWSVHEWYGTNGHYRFKPGDVLKLKHRNAFGYGIDPTFTIRGYNNTDGDAYCVSTHSVDPESVKQLGYNWQSFAAGEPVPEEAEYVTEQSISTAKCNIELHFKKVN